MNNIQILQARIVDARYAWRAAHDKLAAARDAERAADALYRDAQAAYTAARAAEIGITVGTIRNMRRGGVGAHYADIIPYVCTGFTGDSVTYAPLNRDGSARQTGRSGVWIETLIKESVTN